MLKFLPLIIVFLLCASSVQSTNSHRYPTPTPTVLLSPTPTETPLPTETPTPTSVPVQTFKIENSSSAGLPPLPECKQVRNRPTITKVKYLGNHSMALWWTKVEDYVHTYLIEYSLVKGIPMWTTFAEGEYTEIHFLLPGNNWFRVTGTHEACLGEGSEWVDPIIY